MRVLLVIAIAIIAAACNPTETLTESKPISYYIEAMQKQGIQLDSLREVVSSTLQDIDCDITEKDSIIQELQLKYDNCRNVDSFAVPEGYCVHVTENRAYLEKL